MHFDLRAHAFAAVAALCVLSLGAVGCEARVSLGVLCETAGDCPDPFVCIQGRCRAECGEARDCAFPLECIVQGAANVGGCRVPEDGACNVDDDCAGELVCEGSTCVQPCTDHSDCAIAQVCNGRGCVRNVMVGVCDVLSGTGCEEGERCGVVGMRTVAGDGTVTDDRTVQCVTLTVGEVRDAELNQACDANPMTELVRPCRDGLTCVNGQCLRWCLFDEDPEVFEVGSNCGRGSRCLPTYAGAFAPTTCGFCSEGCNPGVQDCLDETRTCTIGTFEGPLPGTDDDFVFGQCVPPAPMVDCAADPMADGCRDRPCAMGRCAMGLDCVTDATSMTTECVERCDVGVVGGCADGRTCDVTVETQVLVADGTTRRLGVCR